VPEENRPSFQAIVDLLNRRKPELLSQLREKYPSEADVLQPGKLLGVDAGTQNEMLRDLAEATIRIAKQECEEVFQLVSRRLRTSSRLRFAGAVISSASSGGLVAALTQGAPRIALATGTLAFISSCFTLIAQYVEDYAGGQNSLRELRERVMGHVAAATEVEAELKLMNIRGDFVGLENAIRKLNLAIATMRQIQLAVS
jgi:hypothetical protein